MKYFKKKLWLGFNSGGEYQNAMMNGRKILTNIQYNLRISKIS
ncbi:hypothetical protein CLMAG_58370 [Clostridium magnum DSM 2767]|uniref:Uncharacterized protein n=1 Tax=Clostridium magnum DSM 2767 TaxID=1121326 RepID=A0A162QTA1_9CLOT|nr:hypothetical protein CLMAG_58370 [Clostridium magnum DSM 2767]SHI54116.1 hypothetical protein SAMN02745944_04484 [Clostridium magnum DSM 2767]